MIVTVHYPENATSKMLEAVALVAATSAKHLGADFFNKIFAVIISEKLYQSN